MTIEQTFTRAFRKALKKGYDPVPGAKVTSVTVRLQTNTASWVSLIVKRISDGKQMGITIGLNDIIFDQDFARAVYGSEMIPDGAIVVFSGQTKPSDANGPAEYDESYESVQTEAFKYHLKQLSILNSIKGRISYIGSTI